MGNTFFVANASERLAYARILSEKKTITKDLSLNPDKTKVAEKMASDGFTPLEHGAEMKFGKKMKRMYLTVMNDEQYIICQNYLLPRNHSCIVTTKKDVVLTLTGGNHWVSKKGDIYKIEGDKTTIESGWEQITVE